MTAIGADLGAVFDQSGERLYLVDEQGGRGAGRPDAPPLRTPPRRPRRRRPGGLPITVTSKVETLAGSGRDRPHPEPLPDLTQAASAGGVVFAGAVGGGYVFPEFLPAYDAIASLAKLLELLAPTGRPLSELVAELPAPTLIHRRLACPWAKKGTVMRVLNERLAGRDLDLTDGIKLKDARAVAGAARPDEPLVHLYEGETTEVSEELSNARCASSSRRSCRRRGRDANLCRSLKLRLTLGIRPALLIAESSTRKVSWNRFPIWPRFPTTT